MAVTLVMFKRGQRRDFPLKSDHAVIGRDRQCDLRIPLGDVSRRHCEVVASPGTVIVRDLGSTNGTYVNGKRVAESPLKPGDHLAVGPVQFVVVVDGKPAALTPPSAAAPNPAAPAAPPPAEGPVARSAAPAKPGAAKPAKNKIDEEIELDLDEIDFDLDKEGSDIIDFDDDDPTKKPKK